jgi:hypothetical protein
MRNPGQEQALLLDLDSITVVGDADRSIVCAIAPISEVEAAMGISPQPIRTGSLEQRPISSIPASVRQCASRYVGSERSLGCVTAGVGRTLLLRW